MDMTLFVADKNDERQLKIAITDTQSERIRTLTVVLDINVELSIESFWDYLNRLKFDLF